MRNVIRLVKEYKGFVTALGMLLVILLMAYICSCFGIHPVTAQVPEYRRTWIAFVLLMGFFLVAMVLLAVQLFVKPICRKLSMRKLYVLVVAVFGLVYMFVLPPMSAPDEIRHYLTAYKLSNQMMFKEAASEEGYVYLRSEDADLLLNDFPGQDDYHRFLNSWRGEVDDTPVLFTLEKAQSNFWIAYVPQALGITLARLLHLRQVPLMLMGRLFNLLFFLFCFWWALRLLPFGSEVLCVAAMLPMTLELISSMSYDAFILALAFLFVAYVLNLAFLAQQVRIKDMVLLTLVMAVMAPLKLVYIFLAFLMFLIPREKFGTKKRYLLSAIGMAVVVAGFFLVLRLAKLNEYVAETNTYLEWADTQSYTLSYLLARPADTFKIFFNSIRLYSGIWYRQMLGYTLGWLELQIPEIMPYLFTMLLMFAAVRPASEPVYWKGKQRALVIVVLILTAAVTLAAMLVAYTPMESTTIEGVQGRYFLPILPLALMVVRGEGLRRNASSDAGILYTACLLNIWTAVNCIALIMSRIGVMRMLSAS